MNRLEFNAVIKTLEISTPLLTFTRRYSYNEQVYLWQNLAISFGNCYYAVIHGEIPLEVINTIYEKYFNSKKQISAHSIYNNWHQKSSKQRKCPETYNIYTKEEFVIFLTEMKDYFARVKNLPETEVQRYDDLMATINSEILRKVDPTISTYEWMMSDRENSITFFDTLSKGSKTSFGKMLRQALDEFDRTINPYTNPDIKLDNVKNYSQKVRINASRYNSLDNLSRYNCCEVHLEDIKTQNRVSYNRNPDGFSYQLLYGLGEEQYLYVAHTFTTRRENECAKGEEIYINYFGANTPQEIDFRYNITHDMVGDFYKEKTPITEEQKEFVYNELLKATSLASSITLANMTKGGNVKQLTSNKNTALI